MILAKMQFQMAHAQPGAITTEKQRKWKGIFDRSVKREEVFWW